MKKIIIGLFLIALSQGIFAAELSDLAHQSMQFKRQTLQKNKRIRPSDIHSLLKTAQILIKIKDCSTSHKVIKTAFANGASGSFHNWLNYAKSAYCNHDNTKASKVAWLALQKANNKNEKVEAYQLLGRSLALRSDWRQDWKPAAIEAWTQVRGLYPDPLSKINIRAHQQIEILNQKIIQEYKEKTNFNIEKSYAKTEQRNPALCFDFNKEIAPVHQIEYQNYLDITPAFKASFKKNYNTLCVYGANYGTTYHIQMKQGLGYEEHHLKSNQNITIKTGHQDNALWFKNSHYLLPRKSTTGIPLYSINTKKVAIQLYRISERNILSDFVQDYFKDNLRKRDFKQIIKKHGEKVWQGRIELPEKWDQQQVSALKLPEKVTQTAGLYLISAAEITKKNPDEWEDDWEEQATQWLVISDIGLSSYQGEEGLTVIARSLETAQPLAHVSLSLLARNNQILDQVTTNKEGIAFFNGNLLKGKGGKKAQYITALDQQGLSFLSLTTSAFDLSDRGVGGRLAAGPMDAFIYTERGVYRPSELVHLVALLRNSLGDAITQLPLTMRLYNPASQVVIEKIVKAEKAGAYQITIPLSPKARTGRWKLSLFTDPNSKPIGQTHFLVAAIKPPRIATTLLADPVLEVNKPIQATLNAQYLFGAPVIERPVKAELILEADTTPFSQYKTYQFYNSQKKVRPLTLSLDQTKTDQKGIAHIPLDIPEYNYREWHQPLKVRLKTQVIDVDGQSALSTLTLKFRHLAHYIGIKKNFKRLAENSLADFEIVYLNQAGKKVQGKLTWQLLEEKVHYQWFYKQNRWQYERNVQQIEVGQGTLMVDNGGVQNLQLPIEQGRYRLIIKNPNEKQENSLVFNAGQALYSQDDTPDTIELSLDKTQYKIGDIAKLKINSPFDGEATLVIASDQIHHIQHFHLQQNTALDIPVQDNWGAGAYALITGYKPQNKDKSPIKRAIGVIWIKQNQSQKQLKISMTLPKEVQPRQTIQIPLDIQNAKPNEPLYISLAAVDEGVLSLTHFKSPNPFHYFFGKRHLGVKIRDHYAQLIQDPNAKPVSLREGAGSSGHRGMPDTNIKVTSLFSGLLTADKQGHIQIPIDLPDYNGRLRLMAVAWSKKQIGSASNPLLVRDPLIVSTSLPRFLAIQDQSQLNILMINPAAPEGEYQIELSSSDLLTLTQTQQKIYLKRNQQNNLIFPIQTKNQLGNAELTLKITGPENFHYHKTLKLGIRGAILPIIEQQFKALEPKEILVLNRSMMSGFYPNTGRVTATLSATPQLDVPALLAKLDRYPHGCLEQTTSRAFPLLYVNELSRRWDYKTDPKLTKRIQKAIRHILQKQRYDGAFGLWSENSTAEFWLTSYALDFLLQAKEKGYEIPPFFIEQALNWLKKAIQNADKSESKILPNISYGYYILTKAGQSQPEEVRYLFDTFLNQMPTALSVGQLAATLAMQGDLQRAKKGFDKVMKMIRPANFYGDYGSGIRDLAATIYLVHEAGNQYGNNAELLHNLSRAVRNKRYFSTQEQAWMILASLSVENNQEMHLKLDHELEFSSTKNVVLRSHLKNQGKTIENTGTQLIWVNLNLQGTPLKMPKSTDHYFKIKRTWYNEKGKPIDLEQIKQGELIFAVIEVKATSGLQHRAILMDLIPAGFEIENADLADSTQLSDYQWLPSLSSGLYQEALDDRFITAFNLYPSNYKGKSGQQKVAIKRFGYLLRAVTAGLYIRPASEVEDMYQPKFRARNEMDQVRIVN